jgi:protein-tyrosine-phosphatase/predicted ATP-grasp superfamily ATP-dependent carboligase
MTNGTVLLLGDDTRSFLAIVRALGRRGIRVHAAPTNMRSPALRSRYITATHELPPWMGDGTEWLAAMRALLHAVTFDLVIPCNEPAVLPMHLHRAQLASLARLALPDERAVEILFDKHATREWVSRLGVPIARGRLVQPEDTAEAIAAELGLPVVVKPRRSYTLAGLPTRGKVHTACNVGQLRQLLSGRNNEETLVEQFFPGRGLGLSLLADRGRLLQVFEHHRVREDSTGSYYRVSAHPSAALVDACRSIVSSLDYTGLGMFEFRRNFEGRWILLEVNARPWGSMALPLALGVDFPYRWYRLLVAGEESPPVDYRDGVFGRNLVPDLQASLAELQSERHSPLSAASFVTSRAVELLRPLTGREVHDVLVRDDIAPAVRELRDLAVRAWRRLGRRPALVRMWARARVRKACRGAGRPRLLFVCQGNICRSPFAAALARILFGEAGPNVESAGTLSRPGRPTPAHGIRAAAARGIDLAAHRSAWLTREAARAASLLIVFDEINRAAVFDRYPDLDVPVICLGDLTGRGSIADPIGGDLADFERVYGRIAADIDELSHLLLDRDREKTTAIRESDRGAPCSSLF